MDIFVEQLVKKKRDAKDFLVVAACLIGALVLVYLLVMTMTSMIGFIVFVAVCGMIYILYMIITSINLEYEYCFTNGALDIDKIINVRKRKRMTELNVRAIEIMGKRSNPNFERYMNNSDFKKIYACSDKKSDDLYFVIYNENGDQKMLLFNPNDKIKDGFKRFNPQKVEL